MTTGYCLYTEGYTVTYLRAVVHHTTVYIRPLQHDLYVEVDLLEAVSVIILFKLTSCTYETTLYVIIVRYISYIINHVIIITDIAILQSTSRGPQEKCLLCETMVPLTGLREHMVDCERQYCTISVVVALLTLLLTGNSPAPTPTHCLMENPFLCQTLILE